MKNSKSNLYVVCRGALCTAIVMLLSSCQTYYRPNDAGWYEFKAIPGKAYQCRTKYREGDVVGPLYRRTYADEKRTTLMIGGGMTMFTNDIPCRAEYIEKVEFAGPKSKPCWDVTRFRFYGRKPVNVRLRFDGDLGKFVEEHGGISLWYPPLK